VSNASDRQRNRATVENLAERARARLRDETDERRGDGRVPEITQALNVDFPDAVGGGVQQPQGHEHHGPDEHQEARVTGERANRLRVDAPDGHEAAGFGAAWATFSTLDERPE
jgi:hypothetical protein